MEQAGLDLGGWGAPGVPKAPCAFTSCPARWQSSVWLVALPGDGTVQRLITPVAQIWTLGWRRRCASCLGPGRGQVPAPPRAGKDRDSVFSLLD